MKLPIKIHLKSFLLVLVLLFITCESGYNELIYFDSANFTVTEMQATDSTLLIKGIVQNECNFSFKTPWYFTYEISPAGGLAGQVFPGEHEIGTQLGCGQTFEWEASYDDDFFRENASSSYQVNNFEAFHILE